MTGKALVISLHPAPERSFKVAKVLECLQQNQDNVVREIGKLYPGFYMSEAQVREEQELIGKFAQIVFVYPMYWYDMPALGRFYLEKVFDVGFAYNLDKTPSKTQGLKLFYIQTCGELKCDYLTGGKCGSDDQIMHIHKDMCLYCGMIYGGCLTIGCDQDIASEVEAFRKSFE